MLGATSRHSPNDVVPGPCRRSQAVQPRARCGVGLWLLLLSVRLATGGGHDTSLWWASFMEVVAMTVLPVATDVVHFDGS